MHIKKKKKKNPQSLSSKVGGWSYCTQPVVEPPPLAESPDSIPTPTTNKQLKCQLTLSHS